MVDLWIALNVVNIAATGFAAIVCLRRYREAARIVAIPHRVHSINLLHKRNARYMRALAATNVALLLLGLWLIGVAFRWRGPIPSFVPIGTGAFAVIWVGWARQQYADWQEMRRIATLAAEEMDRGRAGDAPVVLSLRRRYNAPSG